MKLGCLVVGCLLVGLGPSDARARAGKAAPRLSVDFKVAKRGKRHVVGLVITNKGKKPLVGLYPNMQMAIGFVVMSSLGNVVSPVGIAKVSPAKRRLRLKPKATKTIWLTRRTPTGVSLPFLSGSALFGFRLKPGKTYRIIAIYRPYGSQGPGYTSREKRVTF